MPGNKIMITNPLATDLDHILDHTRDLWDELRGERLFITGGTGFFGCWFLESFLWANERLRLGSHVTVLTRSPKTFIAKTPYLALAPEVALLSGDVRTFAFPPGTFSHVIHAATESSAKLNAENPMLMLDTIVDGTRHTLDFASQCGAKSFLLTSSGAVYGKQPPQMTHIPEDYLGAPDPLDPKSAYGQGKRVAEHLCALKGIEAGGLLPASIQQQVAGLQIKIARCFAFVGPYLPLDKHFAIGNFIRDGLNGGPIVIHGDGTPQRSYLYAADLAIWLWTILFRGQTLHPYNVGSDKSFSIAEVAQRVAEQFRPKTVIEIRGTSNSQKPIERYIPDIQRAKDELNLRIWVGIDNGIQRSLNGYEKGL
jgi:nucleoside-diphosphate-sugar epimerase